MGKDTKLASGTTRGGRPKVMGETMKIRRFDRVSTFCGTFVLALVISLGSAQAQTATEERVKVLEEQLNLMLQQLQDIQRELEKTRADAERAQITAEDAQEQADEIKQAQEQGEIDGQPIVTSGTSKVKLSISGQINRAVNLVDDGDDTDAFFVDNDTSNSRLRFVGTGDMDDGTTLGTRIEVAVSPNNSSDVSQDNEDAGDSFDQRKVEVFARNDSYGQVSFGKGSTASDNTAEFDFSLVAGPIMYSSVADVVSGMQFTDGSDLIGITLGDAFSNFDGNGRKDRILYDTPVFGPGIQASVSADSNDRYDLAVTWGGNYGDWNGVETGDFLTLGAIAISDPNLGGVDYRLNGSGSILHLPTGLSFTVSGGMDKADGDDPYNLYGKIGWDTQIFDFGQTGFGVDFTQNENVCSQCDQGNSAGIAAVQLFEDWGVELYSQFRWFSLDTKSGTPGADDLYALTFGSRVKF